ncbi:MAG: hypothetical protein Q4C87_05025 [Actinomycetaceae bacterium]|nr:hypothetical protein [Actinomycetaceae bacterium]
MISLKSFSRNPRKAHRNPRFISGIVFIALAVVGAASLTRLYEGGTEVLVATQALAPGDRITAANTEVARVSVPGETYLKAGNGPQSGVVSRAVTPGELIPVAIVSEESQVNQRRIVITIAEALPASARSGDRVQIWALPAQDPGGEKSAPQSLGDATFIAIVEEQIRTGSGQRIEVLVPNESLANVIANMGGRGDLTAVVVGR